jgi:hypothetical protein
MLAAINYFGFASRSIDSPAYFLLSAFEFTESLRFPRNIAAEEFAPVPVSNIDQALPQTFA